jgi:DNA-binding transcriptional ArsR family regulator
MASGKDSFTKMLISTTEQVFTDDLMSISEEDTYSMIFSSLKHPIRRKILRILSTKPQSFSDLQKQLNLESSHLTYHIEGLGRLLLKMDGGKYSLSSLGEAAVLTMNHVEEPSARTVMSWMDGEHRKLKAFSLIVLIAFSMAVAIDDVRLASPFYDLYMDAAGPLQEVALPFPFPIVVTNVSLDNMTDLSLKKSIEKYCQASATLVGTTKVSSEFCPIRDWAEKTYKTYVSAEITSGSSFWRATFSLKFTSGYYVVYLWQVEVNSPPKELILLLNVLAVFLWGFLVYHVFKGEKQDHEARAFVVSSLSSSRV